MPKPITIAVLEDEKNFRETIVDLLNTSDDFRCINSFKNVSEFYRHFPTTLPDIFWIDLHLPDGSGIDVISHIKKERPDALCMVCSFFDNDDAVFSALREGADAYLLKSENVQTIVLALKELYEGGSPMSPTIARRVLASFKAPPSEECSQLLTSREQEILRTLARGLIYKEIADSLLISQETVKKHIRNIYIKLQVNNKTEAINKYFNKGRPLF